MKIVIVGGGTAGLAAALGARRQNRDASITVYSDESSLTYSRCGLPYALEGVVSSPEKLVVHDAPFYERSRITFITSTKVVDVCPEEKHIVVESNGTREKRPYDALILATGSKPFVPPLPGISTNGVFPFRTLTHLHAVTSSLSSAQRVVVGGAQLVGLEVAAALRTKGFDVHVVDMAPYILANIFDRDMAQRAQTVLEENGISFTLGKKVTAIEGNGKIQRVVAEDITIPADLFILGFGITPNVELALRAEIDIGPTGAVRTNEYMKTNREGIYAAGECAEIISAVTGTSMRCGLGTAAFYAGYCAGINAAGGKERMMPWANACVTTLFGVEYASVGVTEREAHSWCEPVGFTLTGPLRAEYMPEKISLTVKLVADAFTGRVIGAQFIGKETALHASYIAQAILRKATVQELCYAEFAYCPPLADVTNPVALCARFLQKKINVHHEGETHPSPHP